MSEIEEIRRRDREAVPRMMGGDFDPLLRAEMDRRWLLAEVDRLTQSVGAFSAARDQAKRDWQEEVEQLRQALDSEIENCSKRVEESESFEETSRSVANFLSQKISAYQYQRDQARNELRQRELHHFETEQKNSELTEQVEQWMAEHDRERERVAGLKSDVERLKAQITRVHEELYRDYPDLGLDYGRKYARRLDEIEKVLREGEAQATASEVEELKAQIARMQTSLEACPYGEEGHVLCDCARVERSRVKTLENQASRLQMMVEDLESSFETLAVGHERSHSSYIRGTEAANEIRLVLRQVAERQFGEPGE